MLIGPGPCVGTTPSSPCASAEGRDPVRVVVTRSGVLPPAEAKLFATARSVPTIVVAESAWTTAPSVAARRTRRGAHRGRRGWPAPTVWRRSPDASLLDLLCEGGPGLAGGLLAAGLIDRVLLFLAPLDRRARRAGRAGGAGGRRACRGVASGRRGVALGLRRPAGQRRPAAGRRLRMFTGIVEEVGTAAQPPRRRAQSARLDVAAAARARGDRRRRQSAHRRCVPHRDRSRPERLHRRRHARDRAPHDARRAAAGRRPQPRARDDPELPPGRPSGQWPRRWGRRTVLAVRTEENAIVVDLDAPEAVEQV